MKRKALQQAYDLAIKLKMVGIGIGSAFKYAVRVWHHITMLASSFCTPG
jgi:ribose 5-phosphate isomerase